MTAIITCRVCGISKDESEYSKHKGTPTGKRNICRTCATAAHNKWKKDNKELYNAGMKRYRDKDPKRNARQRQSPTVKAWLKRNIQKVKVWSASSKAKRKNAVGGFTVQEWFDLCNKYDNKCLCCGTTENISVDHVVPISQGGTNYIDNIQPLCLHCNKVKNAKTIDYRCSQ